MALVATRATVAGPHGPLLLPTSLVAEAGAVTYVVADPGPSSTALALALGGRLPLDDGTVTLDGDPADARRRTRVALVDVPSVTEPDGGLPVRVVVGEELALAGLPSGRADIEAFLAEEHTPGSGRWEQLDPLVQTRWLTQTAAERTGIDVLVLAQPDRRGGDPHAWYAIAQAHAMADRTVVVLATHASARLLGLADTPTTFEVGA